MYVMTRDRPELLAIGQRQILAKLVSLDMRVRSLVATQKAEPVRPEKNSVTDIRPVGE